jgi:hypothetical protein
MNSPAMTSSVALGRVDLDQAAGHRDSPHAALADQGPLSTRGCVTSESWAGEVMISLVT